MSKLPKPLHYSLLLIILGIIVGALLSLVNMFTAPYIRENKLKVVRPMLEELVSNADKFEVVTDQYKNIDKSIQDVYVAYVGENQTAVLLYVVTSNRYGDIESLIGIDITTNKFINIKFIASSQTKGFGDVDTLNKHDFKIQGANLDVEIDAYAKASFSSKSVQDAINIAAQFYRNNFKTGEQVDEFLEEIKTILPDAVKYQSIKGNLTIDNNQIVDIYAVYDKDNNLLGVVYHGTAIGYEDGTVETLVGIDIENDKFIRLRVFKTVGQTRSIGGKDVLNNFYKDFGNVDVTESVDTKAGATDSSGAVKEVIDLVSAHYQANKDEIKGLEG